MGKDKIDQQMTKANQRHILYTYLKLHENKLGAHWLWIALERIANGEPEHDVLNDYDYIYRE